MSKFLNKLRRRLSGRVPSRYEHLLWLARQQNPSSLVEIGVWRGDRSVQFLENLPDLNRFVGLDLFEEMQDDTFQAESMGKCFPTTRDAVQARLEAAARGLGASVELLKGPTQETLPELVRRGAEKFDFIYLDGGHSLETIANDWRWSAQLVAPKGVVVFDDYYLNDSTRGAKPLIDSLLRNPHYEVRFFPMNEDIMEHLQITMVSVRPRD